MRRLRCERGSAGARPHGRSLDRFAWLPEARGKACFPFTGVLKALLSHARKIEPQGFVLKSIVPGSRSRRESGGREAAPYPLSPALLHLLLP